MKLDDLKYAQRERIIFLDRCLTWRGAANRRDLMDQFDISNAQAAIDFRTYLTLSKTQPSYDAVRKTYVSAPNHAPLAVSSLTADFEVLANREAGLVESSVPQPVRRADPAIVARLYEAKKSGKALYVKYTSMTSGAGSGQWLAPVCFTSDGENVHLRAFSFKHGEYRDYLPVRIDRTSSFELRELNESLPPDEDWNTLAKIWIQPKAGLSTQQMAVVRDEYGFKGDRLLIETRKALVFYVSRRWRLDEQNSRLEIATVEYVNLSETEERNS